MRGHVQYCFDTLGAKEAGSYPLGIFYCQNGKSANQVFTLTKSGEFRREETCAVVWSGKVHFTHCLGSSDQKWHLSEQSQIVNDKTGLCIDITGIESGKQVLAKTCDPTVPGQIWTFDKKCDK